MITASISLLVMPQASVLYSMMVPNHGEFVTIGAQAFRRSKRLAIFLSSFGTNVGGERRI
ncbi:hypothetical protein BBX46_13030 [Lacticaseibacillus paracasei]|nr:hypothetical protein BBX46_13030 [Lacticaseibacillus paracasei]